MVGNGSGRAACKGIPAPAINSVALGAARPDNDRPMLSLPGLASQPGREKEIAVLANSIVVLTVAVTDLDRSKAFFKEQLGLPVLEEQPFAVRFGAGGGTQISVRRGQPNVGQTVGHFEVDDIEAAVQELTGRGVVFQEYESPKTTNFIAQIGPARGAWFQDPDGNVFGIRQGPVPGAG
jgi:catechol 2,3-dioxygenase-like lactoylglutathione lyase family enzyme